MKNKNYGIVSLLASSRHFMVNVDIARNIGLNEAILIGELASKHCYWLNENRLTEDGYFYISHEDIEYDTTLSIKKQLKAFKHLKELNIIDIKQLGGFNRANYYKLNVSYFQNGMFDTAKTEASIVPKGNTTNVINTYDTITYNTINKLADKSADQSKDSLNNKSLNKNTLNDLNNISPTIDFNEKELNNINSAREAGGEAAESVPVDEVDETSKSFDKIIKNGIYAYDYETLLDVDSDLAKLVRDKLIEYFKLFRGRLNVKQVKGQIESLLKDNNYSVDYVIESINNSYTKNYKGFYSVVPNNKPKSTMVPMSERPGNKNVTQGVSVERSKLTTTQFKVFKGKGEN